ncbi:MAG: HIT domain-containing protein [Pseudomonadota bacterium]
MSKKNVDVRSDIWPDERDVIESPHRLQYVRKLVKPKGCVFCAAAKNSKDPSSLVLFKTRQVMAILNKYPYNNGHLLILPIKHESEYDKLSDSVVIKMQLLMKHSLKILKKVYNPHGFNMGMNLGRVAGAGIPDHVHMHIIPRWGGDTNFFPLVAKTKLVVETTEQSYNSLKPHFEKLEKKGVI